MLFEYTLYCYLYIHAYARKYYGKSNCNTRENEVWVYLHLENSGHPIDGGDTIFPEGIPYSLGNKVCGVQYSRRYRIHSDTGKPTAQAL